MNDPDTGIEKEAIPFVPAPSVQAKRTLEVKYSIAGSGFKTQLPIFEDGNAEEFLHFLFKFRQAQNRLGYNTYQKLESGIEQLLKGTARNKWNTIKNTVNPGTNTVASFNALLDALRLIYIPEPSAIENQKMYLRHIRKNDNFTVPQFLDRIKHINMLLTQFPGASNQDCFTAEEIKRLFYQAMPTRWQTNFINSGQSVMATSIEAIRTYMVQQEQQTDAHRKKTRETNRKSQGQGSNSGSRKGFKINKRPNSNANNSGSSRDKKKRKLSNDDDCPIHGAGHKCGQCYQNQYGDNFRPRRTANASSNHSQGTSRYRNNTSHYVAPNPPRDIQVYHNDGHQQARYASENGTSRSRSSQNDQTSQSSVASSRYSQHYPTNAYYQNQTHDNYICEILANKDEETINKTDYLPEGNVLIRRLNDIDVDTFGLCLFDSGSTTTLMNQRALPRTVKPRVGSVQQYTTTQGTNRAQNYVFAEEILFPDFCKSRIIPSIKIRLFDSPTSRYDVIL